MARYEDYVNRPTQEDTANQLERELSEAQGVSDSRRSDTATVVDARWKGKSVEDVAKSYDELEKLLRRQSDELGTLRRMNELILQQKTLAGNIGSEETVKPVTADDLYENADAAIAQVVRRESAKEIQELKQQVAIANQQAAVAALDRLHPQWRDTLESTEFSNWVAASPYRQRLAASANQYDLAAANDLFSMYEDYTGKVRRATADQERQRQLSDATLESSGSQVTRPAQRVDRSKLQAMRVRARQGDDKAEQWLRDNAEGIFAAYANGQV
jgi:hypothetical protein